MPQFDKITFFTQIFWLFITFSCFYFIFLAFFLPKLAFILKARHKKLQKGLTDVLSFSKEQSVVVLIFNTSVEKFIYFSKIALLRGIDQFSASLNLVFLKKKLNNLTLSNMSSENTIYYRKSFFLAFEGTQINS
jgi:hypothetical protein